ncbi:hypothetical protein ACFL2T_03570 [Elusimicrobiota bacterium]
MGITNIADVAGGRGRLSHHLRKLGFDSTIVDIRDAAHPGWLHRTLRKKSRRSGRLIQIPRVVAKVQDMDLSRFDLIVGLHPDEATEHIVSAAIKHDKDFAIVPCCVFPLDGVRRSKEDWREYLASLSPETEIATLPFNGSNVVLYRSKRSRDGRDTGVNGAEGLS